MNGGGETEEPSQSVGGQNRSSCGVFDSLAQNNVVLEEKLKPQIPILAGVLFMGEARDFREGDLVEGLGGLPGFAQGGLEGGGGQLQVQKEIGVRAFRAVAGLTRRHGQGVLDQGNVEVEQEGAVKDEELALAPLGVAGELDAAQGEVGMALALDRGPEQRGQGGLVAFQNGLVGGGDAAERPGAVEAQDQRVVEDARALQDGAAAGATAQDRDRVGPAEGQVHLPGGLVGVAYDDEVLRRLPEAEQVAGPAGFTEVEQRLVAGEVFFRRGER
jgi:hypothetical protein